jgi:hypothetical protein
MQLTPRSQLDPGSGRSQGPSRTTWEQNWIQPSDLAKFNITANQKLNSPSRPQSAQTCEAACCIRDMTTNCSPSAKPCEQKVVFKIYLWRSHFRPIITISFVCFVPHSFHARSMRLHVLHACFMLARLFVIPCLLSRRSWLHFHFWEFTSDFTSDPASSLYTSQKPQSLS